MSTSDEGALIAGRYRLSSELGRGAMGVVWLARDERLGRTVAVKELRGGVGLSSTQLEQSNLRARREARIAARLHHPNAVAVFDVAEHAGRPYLVMEYVRARTLSETLAEESYLDPVRAAEIGVQLASALAAAHEAGIVHRDVKPGNILLSEDGKAKLTDFGISRAVGDATVTGTGEMLGTPAYVAPEVAQGRPATASSDVFSLGATLYAAVEGEPPFGTGPAVMALLLRIVNGEMRPPRRSGLLTDALLRMMHNDPMSRPSMDAARYELQSVAGSALSLPKQSPTTLPSAPATSMRMRARTPEPGQPATPTPTPAPESAASPKFTTTPADQPPPGRRTQTSDTRVDAATPAEPPTPAEAESESTPAKIAAPNTPAPAPTDPCPTSTTRRRMVPWVVLPVAAVVTAAVVATVVANNGSGNSPQAHSSTSPKASVSASHAAHPAASGGTTGASAPASRSSEDVAAQLKSVIAAYYKLVPNHLDQAWPYMTAEYQQNHAGGWSGYRAFWGQIKSISVSDIVATPPSTVVATLVYHYLDGRVIRQPTRFGLVLSDGVWKIASTSVLSSNG